MPTSGFIFAGQRNWLSPTHVPVDGSWRSAHPQRQLRSCAPRCPRLPCSAPGLTRHLNCQGRADVAAPLQATGGNAARGRHPELLMMTLGGSTSTEQARSSGTSVATAVEPPRPEEVDERYRRADYSDVFQFESRQAFARCIAGGEPSMRLAEAALHVTAEDDAIASHSTVPFPVAAWMERIDTLADQLAARDLRRAAAAVTAPPPRDAAATAYGSGDGAGGGVAGAAEREAAALLRVVERFLFEEVGFRIPEYGRSNLPAKSQVDHAGVWEDARLGYLHETLIRRLGHPATLGLLLGEVCARLVTRGALPCAAAIDTRGFAMLPRAVPLPQLTREALMGQMKEGASGAGDHDGHGQLLNTITSEVLVEMLRHLKRAYWPFPWDSGVDAAYSGAVGSHGGFRSAAKAAIGEEGSATLAAIGQVAAWRLERGIWTSPGAGDLRRARAAAERLVLLVGERCPEERRDLAVLLLHCGEPGAAALEMRTYLAAVAPGAFGGGAFPPASLPASLVASPTGPATAPAKAPFAHVAGFGIGQRLSRDEEEGRGPDPFDLLLCRRMMAMMADSKTAAVAGAAAGEGAGTGTGGGVWEEPEEALSVGAALRATPPWLRAGAMPRKPLPLTW